MREYEPKYPLEILDSFLYPNLLRDHNSIIVSENITWLTTTETEDVNKLLKEIESKVQKSCRDAEVAYHNVSGNRWIFLILNGKPSESNLRRMQMAYERLYRRIGALMHGIN